MRPILEHYMDRANRDRRAKELRQQGYTVRRSSERGQLMHPQYIADWPHPLTQADCGFGNGLYRTYFAAVYCIEARHQRHRGGQR